jgi:hypothetical protein
MWDIYNLDRGYFMQYMVNNFPLRFIVLRFQLLNLPLNVFSSFSNTKSLLNETQSLGVSCIDYIVAIQKLFK